MPIQIVHQDMAATFQARTSSGLVLSENSLSFNVSSCHINAMLLCTKMIALKYIRFDICKFVPSDFADKKNVFNIHEHRKKRYRKTV